jgi:hypothetical protein
MALLPSIVVVIERFARQFAMFAGSGGRLSGEVGIGSCDMTDTDELEACDTALGGGRREVALLLVTVGKQLLTDVVDAGLAQVLESY